MKQITTTTSQASVPSDKSWLSDSMRADHTAVDSFWEPVLDSNPSLDDFCKEDFCNEAPAKGQRDMRAKRKAIAMGKLFIDVPNDRTLEYTFFQPGLAPRDRASVPYCQRTPVPRRKEELGRGWHLDDRFEDSSSTEVYSIEILAKPVQKNHPSLLLTIASLPRAAINLLVREGYVIYATNRNKRIELSPDYSNRLEVTLPAMLIEDILATRPGVKALALMEDLKLIKIQYLFS